MHAYVEEIEVITYEPVNYWPTFKEIQSRLHREHSLLETNKTVVEEYSNLYNLRPTFDKFPHSNLVPEFFEKVVNSVRWGKPPRFVLEVGSYHGHSAITIATVLDMMGHPEVPVLCVDPWTGDANTWLNRDDEHPEVLEWASSVRDGRSLTFDQFMTNVKFATERTLSPTHIVPFHATSFVGYHFLKKLKWRPDVIFLDSSHELHETYLELELFYELLAPGGVMFGDDYAWDAVRHDVHRFVDSHNNGRNNEDTFRFEVWPVSETNNFPMWVIQKAQYEQNAP